MGMVICGCEDSIITCSALRGTGGFVDDDNLTLPCTEHQLAFKEFKTRAVKVSLGSVGWTVLCGPQYEARDPLRQG